MRDRVLDKIRYMFFRVRAQHDLDPSAKRVAFSPCWDAVYDQINRADSDEMGWRVLEEWNEV
jgi:hypothetical protein